MPTIWPPHFRGPRPLCPTRRVVLSRKVDILGGRSRTRCLKLAVVESLFPITGAILSFYGVPDTVCDQLRVSAVRILYKRQGDDYRTKRPW